jgi:aryl-alcohol dehydrogenase-like predicted oxidoreductase
MKTRKLGNTDIHITPIGYGSWAVGGGGYQFGWGPQDDEQSIAAINHALDLGINRIDTAAVYSLGHAEEVVARALNDRSERPYIFTKCGRVWNEIAFVHNVTPGVVAIAWALQYPGVSGAIVGARRPEQVDGIISAAEFQLTDSESTTIEEFLKEHP